MNSPVGRIERLLPPIPEYMNEMLEGKYFIFNVGPKEHVRHMGSFGRFVVPACPGGAEYGGPVMYRGKPGLPSMLPETVVKAVDGRTVEYDWNFTTDGRKFANEILGVGAFHDATNDLTKHGVFLAAGHVPTGTEIEAAKQKLHILFDERVRLADQRYEINGGMETHNGKSVYTITDDDVYACKALGLERPWARKNTKLELCDECGTGNLSTAAFCKQCDNMLNAEAAKRKFPAKYVERMGVESEPEARAPKRKYTRKTAEVAA